jgi:hypothetical protein
MYRFEKGIFTNVPTDALIEVYQMLATAYEYDDWDDVNCAMECIEEEISRYTVVPDGLDISPSVSSIIAPSIQNGILMDDKKDVCCRGGKPVSEAYYCDRKCPHSLNCCEGEVLLENGFNYHIGPMNYNVRDEALMESIKSELA